MSSLTVLTIDDNDSIRLSIASYLEDLGFVVLDAASGEEGLEIIKKERPDLILTDTHMPGLTGIDILDYVKQNQEETPVIVVSGAGEIDSVVKALRAGAWDYIAKPIEDLNFLKYSIDQVLKRVDLIKENREKSLEIKAKNLELNKTINKLTEAQKELVEAEKMASLGYMVSGVSHEINTPLGICLTSISYLKDETRSITRLNESKTMKLSDFNNYTSNIDRVGTIINDSLESINRLISNFKQLSVNKQEEEKKHFSLKEAISSVIRVVISVNEKSNISFNISEDNCIINSYPEAINLIFMKLIENSIVHGFKDNRDGEIDIQLSKVNDNINILFKNNGIRIPENLIDRVFDPFVTENKVLGSGLGLCIVYNLVKFKLLGEVVCKNHDNGVIFEIMFPI